MEKLFPFRNTFTNHISATKLPTDTLEYGKCHSLVEFMAFMHNLPDYLDTHPKVSRSNSYIIVLRDFTPPTDFFHCL